MPILPDTTTFRCHRLNADGLIKVDAVADAFDDLLFKLQALGVAGRGLALATTKLQEACFFSKRELALLPTNQESA